MRVWKLYMHIFVAFSINGEYLSTYTYLSTLPTDGSGIAGTK